MRLTAGADIKAGELCVINPKTGTIVPYNTAMHAPVQPAPPTKPEPKITDGILNKHGIRWTGTVEAIMWMDSKTWNNIKNMCRKESIFPTKGMTLNANVLFDRYKRRDKSVDPCPVDGCNGDSRYAPPGRQHTCELGEYLSAVSVSGRKVDR